MANAQRHGHDEHALRGAQQETLEAWMANDNEGGWCLRDGTVHVLLNGDGGVREYSYSQLEELFGLGPFIKDMPVETYGENSPIPECRKLDN